MLYLAYLAPFWIVSKLFYSFVALRQVEKNSQMLKEFAENKLENCPEKFEHDEEGNLKYKGSIKELRLGGIAIWLFVILGLHWAYFSWLIATTIVVNMHEVSYAMPITLLCIVEVGCLCMPAVSKYIAKSTIRMAIYRIVDLGLLVYVSYLIFFV